MKISFNSQLINANLLICDASQKLISKLYNIASYKSKLAVNQIKEWQIYRLTRNI